MQNRCWRRVVLTEDRTKEVSIGDNAADLEAHTLTDHRGGVPGDTLETVLESHYTRAQAAVELGYEDYKSMHHELFERLGGHKVEGRWVFPKEIIDYEKRKKAGEIIDPTTTAGLAALIGRSPSLIAHYYHNDKLPGEKINDAFQYPLDGVLRFTSKYFPEKLLQVIQAVEAHPNSAEHTKLLEECREQAARLGKFPSKTTHFNSSEAAEKLGYSHYRKIPADSFERLRGVKVKERWWFPKRRVELEAVRINNPNPVYKAGLAEVLGIPVTTLRGHYKRGMVVSDSEERTIHGVKLNPESVMDYVLQTMPQKRWEVFKLLRLQRAFDSDPQQRKQLRQALRKAEPVLSGETHFSLPETLERLQLTNKNQLGTEVQSRLRPQVLWGNSYYPKEAVYQEMRLQEAQTLLDPAHLPDLAQIVGIHSSTLSHHRVKGRIDRIEPDVVNSKLTAESVLRFVGINYPDKVAQVFKGLYLHEDFVQQRQLTHILDDFALEVAEADVPIEESIAACADRFDKQRFPLLTAQAEAVVLQKEIIVRLEGREPTTHQAEILNDSTNKLALLEHIYGPEVKKAWWITLKDDQVPNPVDVKVLPGLIGVSISTLNDYCTDGLLEVSERVGGVRRFTPESVMAVTLKRAPDKRWDVFNKLKANNAFGEDPGSSDEMQRELDRIEPILSGNTHYTRDQSMQLLGIGDIREFGPAVRERFSPVTLFDHQYFPKEEIDYEVRLQELKTLPNPLTITGLAKIIGKDISTVNKQAKKGELVPVRKGDRFSPLTPESVLEYVDRRHPECKQVVVDKIYLHQGFVAQRELDRFLEQYVTDLAAQSEDDVSVRHLKARAEEELCHFPCLTLEAEAEILQRAIIDNISTDKLSEREALELEKAHEKISIIEAVLEDHFYSNPLIPERLAGILNLDASEVKELCKKGAVRLSESAGQVELLDAESVIEFVLEHETDERWNVLELIERHSKDKRTAEVVQRYNQELQEVEAVLSGETHYTAREAAKLLGYPTSEKLPLEIRESLSPCTHWGNEYFPKDAVHTLARKIDRALRPNPLTPAGLAELLGEEESNLVKFRIYPQLQDDTNGTSTSVFKPDSVIDFVRVHYPKSLAGVTKAIYIQEGFVGQKELNRYMEQFTSEVPMAGKKLDALMNSWSKFLISKRSSIPALTLQAEAAVLQHEIIDMMQSPKLTPHQVEARNEAQLKVTMLEGALKSIKAA